MAPTSPAPRPLTTSTWSNQWRGLPFSSILVGSAHDNSFDHLVGDQQQVTRNFEIERFGGFEIDDKFVLGRLLDRKIGGFRALQNLADIDRRAPERIGADRTIRHKAASLGNFSKVGHCR